MAGASTTLPAPAARAGSRARTHSSRMSTTSVRFSKTSCSVMTLGCSTCRRMLTSRSISSRHTPRRLARLCRFLMNLAAYSSPVLFSRHFFTMANWPLWGHRPAQSGCYCVRSRKQPSCQPPGHTNQSHSARVGQVMPPASILTSLLTLAEMRQVLGFPFVHMNPLPLLGMNVSIVIPSVQM